MHVQTLKTHSRIEMIDITGSVREIVKKSGVKSGFCVVYVPHTTAAVTINENADSSVKRDIISKLSQLIPENDNYTHLEGNSDAHVKSSLVGVNVVIPVDSGDLVLGTWQGIYFCEFDGPRTRKFVVQIVGD
ncbi:MAG: hypothetical protein PWQ20_1483 [Thermotogaceae bacterium]|jgi:secondary thiamine-phosphate synthase enzyme|nr:hypothetical protein [Thermotogaceae bacterium]MDN5338413.1 hypothetical protein [Thermotogaceae bacterium]